MSKVVFVGNIPFEMTEEQIIDIFKEVGPVVSFRLMFDRETGKPRGFGFCEYSDVETANSAIRNLNGYDVGGRNLIVNTADNDSSPSGYSGSSSYPGGTTGTVPVAPVAAAPARSFDAEDVNGLLASLTNAQLSDIIMQFKKLATSNPTQASQIFQANPALAYALFQALMNMRLVDPNTVQELYNQQQSLAPSAPSTSPPPQAPQPTIRSPPPPPPPTSGPPAQDEQQRAMLAQIMSLTEEQIRLLPADQQQQVLMIREQLKRQGAAL